MLAARRSAQGSAIAIILRSSRSSAGCSSAVEQPHCAVPQSQSDASFWQTAIVLPNLHMNESLPVHLQRMVSGSGSEVIGRSSARAGEALPAAKARAATAVVAMRLGV